MRLATPIICAALLLATALGAKEEEKKLTKKELPAVVLSAFQKAYPKASIKGIAEEKKEGKTFYEIESIDGKISRDLLYLADGSVAEIEESMDVKELPETVKASVEAKYPKAKIAKVEKATKGTDVSYSVQIKTAKGKTTLDVDATGKVFKEEKAGSKEK